MKCPICDNELKESRKDPRYMLCHHCRKKFRIPGKEQDLYDKLPSSTKETNSGKQSSVGDETEEFHLRYANIPPKPIRKKREEEMRKAYDELLSIGKEEKATKKRRGLFGRRK